jgi:hypothetical protein
MTGTPLVVLDAFVLANFALCDTLLRLAEPPRLSSRNGQRRLFERLPVRWS